MFIKLFKETSAIVALLMVLNFVKKLLFSFSQIKSDWEELYGKEISSVFLFIMTFFFSWFFFSLIATATRYGYRKIKQSISGN